jgi:hypothetical protein
LFVLTSDLQSYVRPSSWRPQRLTPRGRAIALAQKAKVNATLAEAEAARPGEGKFYAAPRLGRARFAPMVVGSTTHEKNNSLKMTPLFTHPLMVID